MRVRIFVCHEAPHFTLMCGSGPCYFAPKNPVEGAAAQRPLSSPSDACSYSVSWVRPAFSSIRPTPCAQACSQAVASLSLKYFSYAPRFHGSTVAPVRHSGLCTPLQPPVAAQRLLGFPPARGERARLSPQRFASTTRRRSSRTTGSRHLRYLSVTQCWVPGGIMMMMMMKMKMRMIRLTMIITAGGSLVVQLHLNLAASTSSQSSNHHLLSLCVCQETGAHMTRAPALASKLQLLCFDLRPEVLFPGFRRNVHDSFLSCTQVCAHTCSA